MFVLADDCVASRYFTSTADIEIVEVSNGIGAMSTSSSMSRHRHLGLGVFSSNSEVIEPARFSFEGDAFLRHEEREVIEKKRAKSEAVNLKLSAFFPATYTSWHGILDIESFDVANGIFQKIEYPEGFFEKVRQLRPREVAEEAVRFGYAAGEYRDVVETNVRVAFLGCETRFIAGEDRDVGFFEVRTPAIQTDRGLTPEAWVAHVFVDSRYGWPVLSTDAYGREIISYADRIRPLD